MTWRTVSLIVGALLAAPSCKSIFGCENKTEIVELVPGEPFFDINADLLDGFLKTGWHCNGESIRNGFGTAIGTKIVSSPNYVAFFL